MYKYLLECCILKLAKKVTNKKIQTKCIQIITVFVMIMYPPSGDSFSNFTVAVEPG